ncbi:MAG: hypothetical protein VYD97_03020 [Pseudomonadota bacterium]|jgi:hypothetical protein|nr:hypothetical protein [Pseudomonadota bacterium]MEC7620705.1 hypothetical protein [Pseudomonadota bacterium]|tara:strand:+ start:247 stop:852 length:606 start_codon:yes stop_codon:yes gene_type:complete
MVINKLARRLYTFALALVTLVIVWSILSFHFFDDFAIVDENNLLENTQVLVLLLSLMLSIRTAINRVRKDKIISIFFSFLSFGFILREIDLEDFDLPTWIIVLGSGSGRTILLVTIFSAIVLYMISKRRYYIDLTKVFFRSKIGASLFLSGCFLIIGSFFEDINLHSSVLIEECFELVAYALFFRAISVISRREIRTSRHI